jgi:hypothetical protein
MSELNSRSPFFASRPLLVVALAVFQAKKGKSKKAGENPFELRFNRRKHEVLGQQIKGEVRSHFRFSSCIGQLFSA